MLPHSGLTNSKWRTKLMEFLGIENHEIEKVFYQPSPQYDLFDQGQKLERNQNQITNIVTFYKRKIEAYGLKTSDAFILRNKTNSPMFHFFMVTSNATGLSIANEVITAMKKLDDGKHNN